MALVLQVTVQLAESAADDQGGFKSKIMSHHNQTTSAFQVKELGTGSSGTTVVAEDSDGEMVAVKLVPRGHKVLPHARFESCLTAPISVHS